MFNPPGVNEKDPIYYFMILMLQCAYFGPFPHKHMELSDAIRMEILEDVEGLVAQSGGRKEYGNTLTTDVSKETVTFLDNLMKLDREIDHQPGSF